MKIQKRRIVSLTVMTVMIITSIIMAPLPVKAETVELNFDISGWEGTSSNAWTFDSVNKILTINEGHTVTATGTAPYSQIEKVSVKGTLAGDAVFNAVFY